MAEALSSSVVNQKVSNKINGFFFILFRDDDDVNVNDEYHVCLKQMFVKIQLDIYIIQIPTLQFSYVQQF